MLFRQDVVMQNSPDLGNCFTFNHKNSSHLYQGKRSGETNGALFRFARSSINVTEQTWSSHKLPCLGLQTRLKTSVGDLLPFTAVNGIRVFVHSQSQEVLDVSESVGYVASPGYRNNYAVRYASFRQKNIFVFYYYLLFVYSVKNRKRHRRVSCFFWRYLLLKIFVLDWNEKFACTVWRLCEQCKWCGHLLWSKRHLFETSRCIVAWLFKLKNFNVLYGLQLDTVGLLVLYLGVPGLLPAKEPQRTLQMCRPEVQQSWQYEILQLLRW